MAMGLDLCGLALAIDDTRRDAYLALADVAFVKRQYGEAIGAPQLPFSEALFSARRAS